MAELEMLPEWAGRKASASPSRHVDPDETAPLPAGGVPEATDGLAVEELEPGDVEVETFDIDAVDVDAGDVEVETFDVDAGDVEVETFDVDAGDVDAGDPATSGALPAFDATDRRQPAQAYPTAEMPGPRRSALVLVALALLALAAGIAAGYLFLVVAS